MTYRRILEEVTEQKQIAFQNLIGIEDILSKTMSLEEIGYDPEHITAVATWTNSVTVYQKLKAIIEGVDYDPDGQIFLSDI